jgi:hypothetical protein
MRFGRRMVVVMLAVAPLLASCTPRVAFFGDSELDLSREEVVAAQTGPDQSTNTVVYGEIGCGLTPPGDTHDCHAGSTQADVDRYWKELIADDVSKGRPAYIQVELGIDDAFSQTSSELQTYASRIRRFLSWLPAGVPVLWDNIPAMAPAPAPDIDTNFRIINRALARVARSSSVLHVVDLRRAFKGHWPDWFRDDQLHYNDVGQRKFARVNCEALNDLSAANGSAVGAPCHPTPSGHAASARARLRVSSASSPARVRMGGGRLRGRLPPQNLPSGS